MTLFFLKNLEGQSPYSKNLLKKKKVNVQYKIKEPKKKQKREN